MEPHVTVIIPTRNRAATLKASLEALRDVNRPKDWRIEVVVVDTDSTDDTDSTTSNTAGLPSAFVKTLQSFGVTPQQFQSDLGAALKAAQQNGGFNISSLFKSFPTGSVVDALG